MCGTDSWRVCLGHTKGSRCTGDLGTALQVWPPCRDPLPAPAGLCLVQPGQRGQSPGPAAGRDQRGWVGEEMRRDTASSEVSGAFAPISGRCNIP